jgi:mannose-6-phosphate isomerase-like protein (cupin superfamily)
VAPPLVEGGGSEPVPPRGGPGVPYLLARREEIALTPSYGPRASGFTRAELVGRATGSTHTGLALCELGEGWIEQHLHSYEESFYVLEGEPVLYFDGRGVRLRPGACGVVPVGVEHAWRGTAGSPARWVEMCSPHPRGESEPADTFFVGLTPDGAPAELDLRDPRNRNLFFLSDRDMNLDGLKQGSRVDEPTVSASMATAALAYSGITVKMLVDQRLGAQLHTMFMVDYQPGGVAHLHDHPFEESYVMLYGEVDVVAAGDRYTLRPGDVFWTGVGCVHAFYETQGGRVRWLETSAPQPPRQHSYRFDRDWDYLQERIDAAGDT